VAPSTEAGGSAISASGSAPVSGGSASASGGASSTQPPVSAGSANMSVPVCTVPFETAPVASKAAQCPKDPTGNLPLTRGRVTFVEAPGAPSVEVELAYSATAMERGLMYRTSMPENTGMLFTYAEDRKRSFWMKNTCIPLDMFFIRSDSIIAGILEQVPTLNLASRSVACPVQHVLELNAGWARAHGITPGMKVKIEG
jgi:uncharacterized membrane protein (UPF0127 family)